jgi:hypothetical protein
LPQGFAEAGAAGTATPAIVRAATARRSVGRRMDAAS